MSQNIKVLVRIRPLNEREKIERGEIVAEICQGERSLRLSPPGGKDAEARNFAFDFVHGINSSQEDIFSDVAVAVTEQALEGYNETIFAYGQTGSGKTFTMMGSPDNKGIIPRLSELVFQLIEKTSAETNCNFLVSASYLEIYNEELHDLLNPKSENDLQIREHPDLGIYVENLCELVVSNSTEILSLLEQGNAIRRVASTSMNEKSSRSHSCFSINLEKRTRTKIGDVERETSLTSKINLVDLAGSERAKKTGATGQTLREGSNINKSLMTLGLVINALSEGKQCGHIPYRDSKLTRLLQQSLGGNSRTIMIAAVSPAAFNYDETLSTLRYATRAKSIQNEVIRNEDVNEKIIRELKQEIDRLKNQYTGQSNEATVSGVESDELNRRLAEVRLIQQQTWQEKQNLTEVLEKERQENMNRVISSLMETMKNEKLEVMKSMKRFQNEKQTLLTKQKALKDKSDEIKRNLEEGLRQYQALSSQFDAANEVQEKNTLNEDLDRLLPSIEQLKEDLVARKKAMIAIRQRAEEVENEINNCKAELISSSSVLAQHEKLAVREEERAKLEVEHGLLLQAERQRHAQEQSSIRDENVLELEECKNTIRRLTQANSDLQIENADLKLEVDRLVNRVVDSEVKLEDAERESDDDDDDKEEDKEEEEEEEEEKKESLNSELDAVVEELDKLKRESKAMFEFLMQMLDSEQAEKETKTTHLKKLLESACKDIIFLTQENKMLQLRCSR